MAGEQSDSSTGKGSFPETSWSRLAILSETDPSSTRYRETLEHFARRYWKPVYTLIRLAYRKPEPEALDLTQELFAQLLESGALQRLNSERGSFRYYLRAAVKNLLIKVARREKAAKRHPGCAVLSLDRDDVKDLVATVQEDSPEAAFDREWVRCVLKDALEQTQRELDRQGKRDRFNAFMIYEVELAGDPHHSYRTVAQRTGIPEDKLKQYLRHVRRVYRKAIRHVVRDTVSTNKALYAELDALFGKERV